MYKYVTLPVFCINVQHFLWKVGGISAQVHAEGSLVGYNPLVDSPSKSSPKQYVQVPIPQNPR